MSQEPSGAHAEFPGSTYSSSNSLRASYQMNESLGTENRNTEFKKGPGFIAKDFRKNVAKYVCAFLNSEENGQLLLGVDNNGKVIGYQCTHQHEDYLRRTMDEAIKDIDPPIFTEDYTIRFVPVTDESQKQIDNMKVIEILIYGANIQNQGKLYSTKQGVFLRRDGSIQELNSGAIQEWIRRVHFLNFETELNRLRDENELLKQNGTLHAQEALYELQEIKNMLTQKKKSVVCEIM